MCKKSIIAINKYNFNLKYLFFSDPLKFQYFGYICQKINNK